MNEKDLRDALGWRWYRSLAAHHASLACLRAARFLNRVSGWISTLE